MILWLARSLVLNTIGEILAVHVESSALLEFGGVAKSFRKKTGGKSAE